MREVFRKFTVIGILLNINEICWNSHDLAQLHIDSLELVLLILLSLVSSSDGQAWQTVRYRANTLRVSHTIHQLLLLQGCLLLSLALKSCSFYLFLLCIYEFLRFTQRGSLLSSCLLDHLGITSVCTISDLIDTVLEANWLVWTKGKVNGIEKHILNFLWDFFMLLLQLQQLVGDLLGSLSFRNFVFSCLIWFVSLKKLV